MGSLQSPPSPAGAPQMPERAHLTPRKNDLVTRGGEHMEDELSNAMHSSLFSDSRHQPAYTAVDPDSYFSTDSQDVSRPESLARPPQGRKNTMTRPLLRQRSLSASSLEDLNGDPYAWLRQTVQEQRQNPILAPRNHSGTLASSLPSSPIDPTSPEARQSTTAKPDYFGAGILSLIAGKGPVREHVSEDVRRASIDGSNRFSMPSMPSLPAWQAPSMPSMPKLQAPSLPNFKPPAVNTWMPAAIGRQLGINAGEGESKKFMDESDQTADEEPDWARIKDKYEKPQLPMVFLHGLFGFSVIGPANMPALQIQYWRGVREALEELGVEVLMTASPASGNIETRAKSIAEQIAEAFPGREINLIGHSMGGLDARYMITHLQPQEFTVRSLTTIATPHRGSPFADYLLDDILGRSNLPSLLTFMNAIQLPGGGRAFDALTTTKMAQFNEDTPDDPSVQYFSYGAQFKPSFVDVFRLPWSIIYEKEGDNDGLVSVVSTRWGEYIATLENVNHLDLVGWVGKVRYAFAEFTGKGIKFKPVSFYLAIAEMLAQKGY